MPDKKSLAQFISERREKLGLNQLGLAKRCNLTLKEIEDIESGIELFVPTTTRQKLAKGLKVELSEIKAYEIVENSNTVKEEVIEDIKERILNGEKDILCPVCKKPLIVRIAKMYDLKDNLMLHPKARCSECPFQLKY